jgi:hypothetical protein
VSAGRQDPVAQAAADFLATATSRVQAENERLQTLKQVKEEAAHLDDLVQKQVRDFGVCWLSVQSVMPSVVHQVLYAIIACSVSITFILFAHPL